jgi:hypothetical protein
MATITFVATEQELRGKRAAVVARMIEQLVEAEGDPVTWHELSEGVEHPHQYTPALIALELVGAVSRWEYIEPGSSRKSTAYALNESVEVE